MGYIRCKHSMAKSHSLGFPNQIVFTFLFQKLSTLFCVKMTSSISRLLSVLFLASAASAADQYLLTVEDYQVPWNVGINVS